MINSESDTPLYVQVADLIRESIDGGVILPGEHLRAEADMEHEYGVGPATITRALNLLTAEGRIVRRRGYRAQVMPEVEREIVKVQRGSLLRMRMPTRAERQELGLPVGVPVMEIHYGGRVTLHAGDRCDFTTS